MYGIHGGWGAAPYATGFPWGGVLMGVFMLALIVLVVFATIRLARSGHGVAKARETDGTETALAILAERFAKGEIDAETFRSMKAELDIKN